MMHVQIAPKKAFNLSDYYFESEILKMKNRSNSFLGLLLVLFVCASSIAQDDKVLFTIGDDKVTVSEFTYIYEKNNRDRALYDKESLEEYLELYSNFKLKVHQAKELGMNQAESYKAELAGYRRQLADSYVIDREVNDQMVEQIYQRNKLDVHLKHILIPIKRRASSTDQKVALDKIAQINKALDAGTKFEEVALVMSEDKGSANNGGDVGYMTAGLPDGYVELEEAMYNTPPGSHVGPIRTDFGYHWVKVVETRPARGRMELAHILIRKKNKGKTTEDAKGLIDAIHNTLKENPDLFEDVVKTSSQDEKTKNAKGYLGYIGIGQYEKAFEDAAFSLTQDGQISAPIETSTGYHIIKRISKKAPDSKEQIAAKLKDRRNTGERFNLQKVKVVKQIQEEAGFQANAAALKQFMEPLGNDFFDFNWTAPEYEDMPLFNYGDRVATINTFADYVKRNNKVRIRGKSNGIDETVNELYQNYIGDEAIAYIETQLEDRYVEFKNLLREYEEGILLFEITKNAVWDKASTDTVGLKRYYTLNQNKYIWEPRADISAYSVRTVETDLLNQIMAYIQVNTPEDTKKHFNTGTTDLVMHQASTVERSSDLAKGVIFKEGTLTSPDINQGLRITRFKKVEKVYPASKKTLKESRGYVISDYQDQLEREWIADLRERYDVNINRRVLRSLIKN
jgi:peptidyl-prolyl cis-trans isomerase SurA